MWRLWSACLRQGSPGGAGSPPRWPLAKTVAPRTGHREGHPTSFEGYGDQTHWSLGRRRRVPRRYFPFPIYVLCKEEPFES